MADKIGIEVTGARQVGLKFDRFPSELHDRLLTRITALTDELAARIRGAAPDRTGKLRGEIESRIADKGDKGVAGYVFLTGDFAKAGALEYGAPGPQNRNEVKAHRARLDHVFARRLTAPLEVMVKAHTRHLHITARRFERDPTAAMSAEILAAVEEEVAAVAADDSDK